MMVALYAAFGLQLDNAPVVRRGHGLKNSPCRREGRPYQRAVYWVLAAPS